MLNGAPGAGIVLDSGAGVSLIDLALDFRLVNALRALDAPATVRDGVGQASVGVRTWSTSRSAADRQRWSFPASRRWRCRRLSGLTCKKVGISPRPWCWGARRSSG